jgi:hypothetical protein
VKPEEWMARVWQPSFDGRTTQGWRNYRRDTISNRPAPYVIYGGDTAQKRQGVTILPWSALHSENWVTPAL